MVIVGGVVEVEGVGMETGVKGEAGGFSAIAVAVSGRLVGAEGWDMAFCPVI